MRLVASSHPNPSSSGPKIEADREDEVRSSGPFKTDRAAEALPEPRRAGEDLRQRQDALLDEAIEETCPARDPISPQRITR